MKLLKAFRNIVQNVQLPSNIKRLDRSQSSANITLCLLKHNEVDIVEYLEARNFNGTRVETLHDVTHSQPSALHNDVSFEAVSLGQVAHGVSQTGEPEFIPA